MTIKEIRAACGMTQTELGNYLHIPMRTIQNWENGVSVPPDYVLELIEYKVKKEKPMSAYAKYVLDSVEAQYQADLKRMEEHPEEAEDIIINNRFM